MAQMKALKIDKHGRYKEVTLPRSKKLIYVLRAQCSEHGLDKMITFFLPPNAKAKQMYEAYEKLLSTERFPEKYACNHDIKFTREIDRYYVWDTHLEKAVPRVAKKKGDRND